MRQLVSVVALFAACASVLAACGGNGGTGDTVGAEDLLDAAYLGPDTDRSASDYEQWASQSLAMAVDQAAADPTIIRYGLITFDAAVSPADAVAAGAPVLSRGEGDNVRVAAIVPPGSVPIVVPEPSAGWDRTRIWETYLGFRGADQIRSLVILADVASFQLVAATAPTSAVWTVEVAEGRTTFGALGIRSAV